MNRLSTIQEGLSMRLLIVLSFAFLASGIVTAAPAPPPRSCAVEVILGASDASSLRSSLLGLHLQSALRNEAVRQLTCVKTEKNPTAWVTDRLTTETVVGGKGVRVRLQGVSPKETLALMTAMVDSYAKKRERDRAELLQVHVMRNLIIQQQQVQVVRGVRLIRANQIALVAPQIQAVESDVNLPAIVEAPRVVRPR